MRLNRRALGAWCCSSTPGEFGAVCERDKGKKSQRGHVCRILQQVPRVDHDKCAYPPSLSALTHSLFLSTIVRTERSAAAAAREARGEKSDAVWLPLAADLSTRR